MTRSRRPWRRRRRDMVFWQEQAAGQPHGHVANQGSRTLRRTNVAPVWGQQSPVPPCRTHGAPPGRPTRDEVGGPLQERAHPGESTWRTVVRRGRPGRKQVADRRQAVTSRAEAGSAPYPGRPRPIPTSRAPVPAGHAPSGSRWRTISGEAAPQFRQAAHHLRGGRAPSPGRPRPNSGKPRPNSDKPRPSSGKPRPEQKQVAHHRRAGRALGPAGSFRRARPPRCSAGTALA